MGISSDFVANKRSFTCGPISSAGILVQVYMSYQALSRPASSLRSLHRNAGLTGLQLRACSWSCRTVQLPAFGSGSSPGQAAHGWLGRPPAAAATATARRGRMPRNGGARHGPVCSSGTGRRRRHRGLSGAMVEADAGSSQLASGEASQWAPKGRQGESVLGAECGQPTVRRI